MTRRRRLLVLLTLLISVAVGTGAALAFTGGGGLPRVTVAGVDVSGASREEARLLVGARAETLLARPLRVGGITTTGAALGGRPRIDEALDQAESSDALDRLVARLGGGSRTVALAFDFDRRQLGQTAARLRISPAVDAQLLVDESGARVVPARPGRGVTATTLADALRFLPEAVDPPPSALEPDVSTAEAVRARELVERLTGAARTVALRDAAVTLEPATLRGSAYGTWSPSSRAPTRPESRV
jgi:hypothetical protein